MIWRLSQYLQLYEKETFLVFNLWGINMHWGSQASGMEHYINKDFFNKKE